MLLGGEETRGGAAGLQTLSCSFLQVEQEQEQLLRRQTDAILELQQKIGLKEQLLQRKISALTQTVEKREAQLYAVLSAANLDPATATAAANKLQVPFSVGPLSSL